MIGASPFACRDERWSLLNPMEIHVEGNLQYNRYD